MMLWTISLIRQLKQSPLSLYDEIAKVTIPQDDEKLAALVVIYQTHRHSHTCTKSSGAIHCKFGFPQLPADRNILSSLLNPAMDENGKRRSLQKRSKILKTVKLTLEQTDQLNLNEFTLESVLNQAKVSSTEYHHMLGL